MVHSSVISLFEDSAKSLSDTVVFGYGALSDFASIKNKRMPYVWVDPIEGGFPVTDSLVSSSVTFKASINFLDFDDPKGNEDETARTWDKMFNLMEQFIHKLDQFLLNNDEIDDVVSDKVELSNVRFVSRRKGTDDVLSGWTLTFDMTVPSDFNYCSIYE